MIGKAELDGLVVEVDTTTDDFCAFFEFLNELNNRLYKIRLHLYFMHEWANQRYTGEIYTLKSLVKLYFSEWLNERFNPTKLN